MTLQAVLLVAAALFSVGLYGALSQQVVVMVMMGLELMLNGVILAAGAMWWFLAPAPSGQVLLLVVVAAMTVEMAMGFAVATLLHRAQGADMTDMATDLPAVSGGALVARPPPRARRRRARSCSAGGRSVRAGPVAVLTATTTLVARGRVAAVGRPAVSVPSMAGQLRRPSPSTASPR